MLRVYASIILVVLAVSVAGCYVPEETGYAVDFDGTVEQTEGTFRMTGHLEIDSGAMPTRNLTSVSVVLYESPGTVDERIGLGGMSTNSSVAPSRRSVDVTSSSPPAYVLVESPDFWEDDQPASYFEGVIAFRWTGNEYERYWVTSKDERLEQ